jgi:predicted enzyme related to lactoylglutathione lyase
MRRRDQGGVFHVELHTDDSAGARSFFSSLLGWHSEEVGGAGHPYVALSVGDRVGGGIVECGSRPAQWVPYVLVSHLEVAIEAAGRLGAEVVLEPREGPSGWRGIVATPESGAVALWQLKSARHQR